MKLSVVIPAFNSARYIRRSLDAVMALEAGGHELEVVVVDDGSTDGTAELVQAYPVRLVRQGNAGPAGARNTGWRHAAGEFVFFTDSDCVPSPGWLLGLLPGFDDPRTGAVAGSYAIANPESWLARLIQAEIAGRHRRMPDFVKAGGTYNLAVRRKLLERLGGFDESFPTASGEDNDLSYRIREAGYRIAFRRDCRVSHHHPERLGNYVRTQFVHGYWRFRLYRKHPRYMSGDDYTRPGDMAEIVLAALVPAGVVASAAVPAWGGLPAAGPLGALLALEAFAAGRLAAANRDWVLGPAGAFVYTIRAFYRAGGLAAGAAGALAGPARQRSRAIR